LVVFDNGDDIVVACNDDDDSGGGVAESKTRVFAAIVEMLRWFAGPQIRNTAVNTTSAFARTTYLLTYLLTYSEHYCGDNAKLNRDVSS